jgi:iterative type I PKS product template protein
MNNRQSFVLSSLGEYAALVTAGVLTLTGALTIVGSRARLLTQKCDLLTSGMMAINLSPATVSDILGSSQCFAELVVACYNSDIDCVVAGPLEELKLLKAHLDGDVHCRNVILSIPFASHTNAMHPIVDDLTSIARRVSLRAPSIPVISGILGDVVPAGDNTAFTPEYFARHCMHPVLFDNGIKTFLEKNPCGDVEAWIEIGPHTATLPMLKTHPILSKRALLLGSLRKEQDAWATLTGALAKLYTAGAELNWRQVFSHLSVVCIDLPSYPFAKTRFWTGYAEQPLRKAEAADLPLEPLVLELVLDCRRQFPSSSNGHVAVFEIPVHNLAGFILGHRVADQALCPASIYHELALGGVQLAKRHTITAHNDYVLLRAVKYTQPLVYDGNVVRTVRTTITFVDDMSGTFRITSHVEGSTHDGPTHCCGEFVWQSKAKSVAQFHNDMRILSQRITSITSQREDVNIYSTHMAYEIIFPRVVHYASEYHTIQSLIVDPSIMEGYAIIKLPINRDRGKFVVHPIFMDTLLHVAGFVANLQGGEQDVHICSHVDSIKVIPDLVDNDETYGMICRTAWLSVEGVVVADAYAVKLTSPQTIVAHLEGIRFFRVRLNNLRRTLSLASRTIPNVRTECTIIPSAREIASSREIPHGKDICADIQSAVIQIIAESCDIDMKLLTIDTDLASLGVDSLLSIEIFSRLQAIFVHTNLNSYSLNICRTLEDIVKIITNEVVKQTEILRTTADLGGCGKRTSVFVDAEIAFVDQENESEPDALGLGSPASIRAPLAPQLFASCATVRATQLSISNQPYARAMIPDLSTSLNVIEYIDPTFAAMINTSKVSTLPFPLQQCQETPNLPLFLIHDGGGLVHYYNRLSPLGRRVWGISNPNFITGQPWDSITSMATHYATLITKTVSGPLLLGGNYYPSFKTPSANFLLRLVFWWCCRV